MAASLLLKTVARSSLLSMHRATARSSSGISRIMCIRDFSKERDSQLVSDAISALGGTSLKSSTFSKDKPEGLSDSEIETYLSMDDDALAKLPGETLRELGNEFVKGSVVIPDQTQSIFFWQLAKANGDMDASYSLAIATYKGDGIEADPSAARDQLEELASRNHAYAKYSLAKILLDESTKESSSVNDIEANQQRALELYESAARGGVLRALNNVANMYASGLGTSKDEVKARKWYEAASEMGDPLAMFTLASWCNTGRGARDGKVDYESGLKWNELAAMSGLPRAQFNLGFHFLVGQGTEKDVPKAIEWFKMAAEKGITEACVNLGEIYRIGMGVSKPDYDRARVWHQKAAAQGSQASIDLLADEANFAPPKSSDVDAKHLINSSNGSDISKSQLIDRDESDGEHFQK